MNDTEFARLWQTADGSAGLPRVEVSGTADRVRRRVRRRAAARRAGGAFLVLALVAGVVLVVHHRRMPAPHAAPSHRVAVAPAPTDGNSAIASWQTMRRLLNTETATTPATDLPSQTPRRAITPAAAPTGKGLFAALNRTTAS